MSAGKLPDGWTHVKLGEVVDQIKDRVTSVATAPGVYVPGGSINRRSYEVSQWLPVDDGLMGPAFHMVAHPGDVLYKSRVPHGVAVADRAGICANTTYVLRTRDKGALLQDFIPYVLSTSQFLEHESLNDKGSTNLYLNFSDIAKYEFALPPVKEQQRVAEILGAVADLQAASEAALVKLDAAVVAVARSAWAPLGDLSLKPEMVPLRELADLKRGRFSHRPRNEPRLYDSGGRFPFVQTGDVQNAGRHLTRFSQFLSQEGTTYSRCVPAGTLLVTIAAVIGATAWTTAPTYLPDSIVSIEPKAGVSGGYLELLIRALRRKLENEVATENTQKNLSVELLGSVLVPRLDRTAQEVLVSRAEALWATMSAAQIESERARVLAATLRESLLSEGL